MGDTNDIVQAKREEQYNALKQLITKRRQQVEESVNHNNNDDDIDDGGPPEFLLDELYNELRNFNQGDTIPEFLQLLPHLVDRKQNKYEKQTDHIFKIVLPTYHRILQGYETKFGENKNNQDDKHDDNDDNKVKDEGDCSENDNNNNNSHMMTPSH
jgi:hypothetical protein